MSNHLSEDQIANVFLGQATAAELQHSRTCSQCSRELERFGQTIQSFRQSINKRIDEQPERRVPLTVQPAPAGAWTWRWALAAAAAFVLIIPFVTREIQPERFVQRSSESDADELMNAVNLHLSRTMPAPMEPILVLLPAQEIITESGGTQ